MNLDDQIKKVVTRADLAAFVQELAKDQERNPESWEQVSIHQYLEAVSAWLSDMDGYYKNQNLPMPEPTWQLLGDILLAAKTYE